MRQILLPKCWGLTPQDAHRIADALGIRNVTFITLPRRSARSPFSAPANRIPSAGSRFLAAARAELS